MLEGRCFRCGKSYYGWALKYRPEQEYSECGVLLEIIDSGDKAPEASPAYASERPCDGSNSG